MESITNYNVLLLHGAYGSNKGFLNETDPKKMGEAYFAENPLDNGANIGRYVEKVNEKNPRFNQWLRTTIFEEPVYDSAYEAVHHSSVYHWRSFSNPANSSIVNAEELGDRTWNLPGTLYEKRRALVEEAQEVKAQIIIDENDSAANLYGQSALDSIRKNPDLYRQLASRYILIGHSMGGVVAREYTQNSNYYHGDVDKIITLDSPHEGTGALNMQLDLVDHSWAALQGTTTSLVGWSLFALNMRYDFMAKAVAIMSASWATLLGISNFVAPFKIEENLQDYSKSDGIVDYVSPRSDTKDNILNLKHIAANDSQPMFRLMGGEHSITYTDPYKEYTDWTGLFIPEGLTQAFMNFFSQMYESDDMMSTEAFTLASKAATIGLVSSVSAGDQGTNLVSKWSGWAEGTESLKDAVADVKRWRFDAAPHDDADGWRTASAVLASVAGICLAADVALSWYEPARIVANTAAVVGSVAVLSNMLVSLLSEDLITEIKESHNLPINNVYDNQAKWFADASNTVYGIQEKDTVINPLIMEDFLYEKPFVNLLMGDAATLDSLKKDTSATLNKSCY
ncbi:MAG: alpha/beta fold hydrolase, partial [Fibrobacter sp.]|nr:alpha/beta fold hydrolase [Fibrobacter sp.]